MREIVILISTAIAVMLISDDIGAKSCSSPMRRRCLASGRGGKTGVATSKCAIEHQNAVVPMMTKIDGVWRRW